MSENYQPILEWDVTLPVAGKSPRQRHASASGAIQASKGRPQLALAYLALLKAVGPLSDQAASDALGCGLSSINSTRGGLGALVVDSGEFEIKAWPNGGITKRTRWMVAR